MSECEREVSADLLSVILPAAARRAIGAYEIFSSIPPDGGDAKEFGALPDRLQGGGRPPDRPLPASAAGRAAAAPKPGTGVPSKDDEYAEIYDRARARIALLDGPDPLDEANPLEED